PSAGEAWETPLNFFLLAPPPAPSQRSSAEPPGAHPGDSLATRRSPPGRAPGGAAAQKVAPRLIIGCCDQVESHDLPSIDVAPLPLRLQVHALRHRRRPRHHRVGAGRR
ncbi:hypothetical protein EMIHUDRAFT_435227, partial [Emiliania huxleyi CCMP1516]|uniref:Uncharacterized protein n=2 Tax=Emiliania huxleyi TaxID=2903 RepID=A0A0D3JQT1_EMIH1